MAQVVVGVRRTKEEVRARRGCPPTLSLPFCSRRIEMESWLSEARAAYTQQGDRFRLASLFALDSPSFSHLRAALNVSLTLHAL